MIRTTVVVKKRAAPGRRVRERVMRLRTFSSNEWQWGQGARLAGERGAGVAHAHVQRQEAGPWPELLAVLKADVQQRTPLVARREDRLVLEPACVRHAGAVRPRSMQQQNAML